MKVRFIHPAIGAFAVPLKPFDKTVVGRGGAGADIEITWDQRISRRHAQLWLEGEQLWIEDLSSRNGSWRGETRLVHATPLARGSSVLMGETVLVVPESDDEEPEREVEQTHEVMPESLLAAIAAATTQPHARPTPDIVPDETQHTMDLPLPSLTDSSSDLPNLGVPVPPPDSPRLIRPGRVLLETDQPGLAETWERELKKGGLYVHTATPPDAATTLDVRIETPHGGITLHAKVVSVVLPDQSKAFGMPPGAGLQITDLTGPRKEALQAYALGTRSRLEAPETVSSNAAHPEVGAALERARGLLKEADQDALYAALGISATATPTSIRQAVDALAAQFSSAGPLAAPPQAARLQAAQTALERVGRILLNEEIRLEYDFRSGHVRAAERIAQADGKNSHDVAALRRVWNRANPDKVDEAARLTRKAFAARQEQDLDRAVRHGRRALEMNPFFEELQKTVEVWERQLRGR